MAPSPIAVPLESLIDSLPDPFIVFEPAGGIVMVNRAALELLGYDPSELVGQAIELVLPALGPSGSAPAAWLPASPPGPGLITEARRRGGSTIGVECGLTSLEAGSRRLILGRVQVLAEHTAELKDEFLSTLAHELRTPLQAMLGWTELLRSRPRDEKTTARALEVIERNIRRQAEVIDGLIDLAEILSGPLRLDVRPVRATPIIDAALERTSAAARAKGIRLFKGLEAEGAEILADPDRLERVLGKFVSNALHYSAAGGDVEVRSQVVDSFLQITVRDTGRGIDPADLPYIFDSIRQVDESEGRGDWPGVHLSVVRSLMELQGGSVRAESAGRGSGASFSVSVPLSDSSARS